MKIKKNFHFIIHDNILSEKLCGKDNSLEKMIKTDMRKLQNIYYQENTMS